MSPPPTYLDQPPGASALCAVLVLPLSLLRAGLRCQLCSHIKLDRVSKAEGRSPVPCALPSGIQYRRYDYKLCMHTVSKGVFPKGDGKWNGPSVSGGKCAAPSIKKLNTRSSGVVQ